MFVLDLKKKGIGLQREDTDPSNVSNNVSLDIIKEPLLRRFVDYWLEKRAGRSIPLVTDIDPVEIPWALSRIFWVDKASVPGGWRIRLAGTEVERVFGRRSLKNVVLSDLFDPENYRLVNSRMQETVDGPSVVYMHGRIYRAAERSPIGGRVQLPLADPDTGSVDTILGMTVWTPGDLSQDGTVPDDLDLHIIDVSDI